MIFQATITTNANTLIASPKVTPLIVTYGLIYRLEIQIPFGSVGLLGVRIRDNTKQIYPSTNDEWFTGQGVLLGYDDKYAKYTEPFEFVIETYNLDDTYNHRVTVRVAMAVTTDEIASLFPNRQVSALAESMAAGAVEETTKRRNLLQKALDYVKGAGGQ